MYSSLQYRRFLSLCTDVPPPSEKIDWRGDVCTQASVFFGGANVFACEKRHVETSKEGIEKIGT